MTDIQFHFEVMQPMDRPVHRWDTCCDAWMREGRRGGTNEKGRDNVNLTLGTTQ